MSWKKLGANAESASRVGIKLGKKSALSAKRWARNNPNEAAGTIKWGLGGLVLGMLVGGSVGVAALGGAVGVPVMVVTAVVGAVIGNQVGIRMDKQVVAKRRNIS
jgi:uncharacterized protein YcfJ